MTFCQKVEQLRRKECLPIETKPKCPMLIYGDCKNVEMIHSSLLISEGGDEQPFSLCLYFFSTEGKVWGRSGLPYAVTSADGVRGKPFRGLRGTRAGILSEWRSAGRLTAFHNIQFLYALCVTLTLLLQNCWGWW